MIALLASLLLIHPASQDNLDAVIQSYYSAIGGRDALMADTTLRMSGTYQEGTFHATGTMLWRRKPLARRVSVTAADGFAYVEIFDGSREWEYSETFSKPAQLDTGAAERAGRRGAEFDESFVDYEAKGHTAKLVGLTTLNGTSVYQIHVTLADGWEKDYYLDAASGLIFAMRKAMPVHARGESVESLSYYSDYRRVGKVLRPFRMIERNTRTGAVMSIVQWNSIEENVPIRAAAFLPP